jgi:hypothetical protein
MWLFFVAVILFIIWLISRAIVHTITAGMWILLAFAVAFLIAHLFTRVWMRTQQLKP